MSLARERIEILFSRAEMKASEERMDLADRYVELGRKIGMKAQEPIPEEFKFKCCGKCNSFLRPGIDSRKRINSKNNQIVFTCKKCKTIKRYSLEDEE